MLGGSRGAPRRAAPASSGPPSVLKAAAARPSCVAARRQRLTACIVASGRASAGFGLHCTWQGALGRALGRAGLAVNHPVNCARLTNGARCKLEGSAAGGKPLHPHRPSRPTALLTPSFHCPVPQQLSTTVCGSAGPAPLDNERRGGAGPSLQPGGTAPGRPPAGHTAPVNAGRAPDESAAACELHSCRRRQRRRHRRSTLRRLRLAASTRLAFFTRRRSPHLLAALCRVAAAGGTGCCSTGRGRW